jgi:hypothetical protein
LLETATAIKREKDSKNINRRPDRDGDLEEVNHDPDTDGGIRTSLVRRKFLHQRPMEAGACPQGPSQANTGLTGGDIQLDSSVSQPQHKSLEQLSRVASPRTDVISHDEFDQVTDNGSRLHNLWRKISSTKYQLPWEDKWGQRLPNQLHDADFYCQSWFIGLLVYIILSTIFCAGMLLTLDATLPKQVAVTMVAQIIKTLVWFFPSVLIYAALFIHHEDLPSAGVWFIKKAYPKKSPETQDKYLKIYIGIVVLLLLTLIGFVLFTYNGVPVVLLPGARDAFRDEES